MRGERLGACDHGITQIMQFAEMAYEISYRNIRYEAFAS